MISEIVLRRMFPICLDQQTKTTELLRNSGYKSVAEDFIKNDLVVMPNTTHLEVVCFHEKLKTKRISRAIQQNGRKPASWPQHASLGAKYPNFYDLVQRAYGHHDVSEPILIVTLCPVRTSIVGHYVYPVSVMDKRVGLCLVGYHAVQSRVWPSSTFFLVEDLTQTTAAPL